MPRPTTAIMERPWQICRLSGWTAASTSERSCCRWGSRSSVWATRQTLPMPVARCSNGTPFFLQAGQNFPAITHLAVGPLLFHLKGGVAPPACQAGDGPGRPPWPGPRSRCREPGGPWCCRCEWESRRPWPGKWRPRGGRWPPGRPAPGPQHRSWLRWGRRGDDPGVCSQNAGHIGPVFVHSGSRGPCQNCPGDVRAASGEGGHGPIRHAAVKAGHHRPGQILELGSQGFWAASPSNCPFSSKKIH